MPDAPPLRTLIVDDEPLAIERLQILCAVLPELILVGTASNGAAALRLAEALAPDLLLLDIAMPDLDGVTVARTLAERSLRAAIIFVTAFDQFAVTAFDIGAVDYLLKPVAPERLARAIARVRTQIEEKRVPQVATKSSPWLQEFWVPHRSQLVRVTVREIDLIEAERDYMRLHIGDRSYLMHETIAELERRLDPAEFARVHRSTIVQRDRIAALKHDGAGTWQAELRDGRVLRIGRTYLAGIRAMVGR